jgi:hypothetical protein
MTKGQQIVGGFNPTGNPDVDAIKVKAAELIDLIDQATPASVLYGTRAQDRAIDMVEEAAMLAVKAVMHR